ncbi:MAG: branched-chain amino acid ABC transporter permease, partial [Hydrogenophaga sp.]|nr:branched-chain amino acid ABC transporter permease [Hydrogenophaga sp.]
IYLMSLGLLLILCVLYLPGGLASLRWATFTGWKGDIQSWWRDLRDTSATKKKAQKEREEDGDE